MRAQFDLAVERRGEWKLEKELESLKTGQRLLWTSRAWIFPDMVGDPTPEPRSAMVVFLDFRRGLLERLVAPLQHTREHARDGLSLFSKIPKFPAWHLFC